MKKSSILILIILFAIIAFASCSNNPYSGKYTLKTVAGNILELKDDNNFTLYIEYGKNSHAISGKYNVDDNKINLIYADKDSEFMNDISTGKVEGNRITFYDKNDRPEVFLKE